MAGQKKRIRFPTTIHLTKIKKFSELLSNLPSNQKIIVDDATVTHKSSPVPCLCQPKHAHTQNALCEREPFWGCSIPTGHAGIWGGGLTQTAKCTHKKTYTHISWASVTASRYCLAHKRHQASQRHSFVPFFYDRDAKRQWQ